MPFSADSTQLKPIDNDYRVSVLCTTNMPVSLERGVQAQQTESKTFVF